MKCRKKPIVIEAYQLTKEEYESFLNNRTFISAPDWLAESENIKISRRKICIKTMEGPMIAGVGDYIMRGVEGELYPCNERVFKKTYEVVEDDG